MIKDSWMWLAQLWCQILDNSYTLIQRNSKTVSYICSVLSAKENCIQKGGGDIFYLLNSDLVKLDSSRAGMGQAWLNECLKPFTNFQSGPFARAHRISAWPHSGLEHTLGKADTMQRCSQAEQTSPQRHKVRKTPKPSSSMGWVVHVSYLE